MQIPGIFRVKNVRSQYIYIHIALNTEHPRYWGAVPVSMLKRICGDVIVGYLFLKLRLEFLGCGVPIGKEKRKSATENVDG